MSVNQNVWVERYRPEGMDDIIGHEQIKDRMKEFIGDPEMPNLLFAGPQGVGKTAMIQAFCREKYESNWRGNMLEMNASDERGIDTVREKIKGFARTGAVDSDFKIIFLDEADQLTNDAQPALRRVMEDYSDVTRFVLSCNYPNQIIDPLQSRCAPFYFNRLDTSDVQKLIVRVLTGEGIEFDQDTVEKLAKEADGDGRKAINMLQVAVDLDAKQLREEWADVQVSPVDKNLISEIVDMALTGELDDAMAKLDSEVIKQGVNHQMLAKQFLYQIKRRPEIPADARVKMVDKVAEVDYRVMYGANPQIQFHSLIADLHVARHLSIPSYREANE
jgi:replication factor C small subunit